MSLTSRLTGFFLLALALVLLGFSAALYLAARTYLVRQADDRLGATLAELAAASEMQPNGVEWEPREHRLSLGADSGPEAVRWTVHDGSGKLIDRSANLGNEDLRRVFPDALNGTTESVQAAHRHGEPWHVQQRRLLPTDPKALPHNAWSGPNLYPSLVLTAGLSLAPTAATLRTLALALTALSTGVWFLAALVGRRLCRRALLPVARMAEAASAMSAADLGHRLPAPRTGDELQALGHAFNGLLTRLEDAFERQRRFTGDASHQLRTPLTAMLGQLEVVLRRDRPAAEYRQVLAQVRAQAERLHRLVEMLLFLARREGEGALTELEVLDLAAWLPEHLQEWSSHLRGADMHIQSPSGQAYWVRVQLPLLDQLVDNLLDNACKYSSPRTPIVLRLGRESDAVTLSIEDQGPGIGPEDLPHVFEPLYRSARVRRQGRPGVGLGLAVARRIAEAFGGTLVAQSEFGRGSRFTVRLPSASPAQIPMPTNDHAAVEP